MKDLIPAFFKTGIRGEKWIPAFQVVAKSPEKKGTTKDTKSTKKSFSFPLWFIRKPSLMEG